MVFLIIDVLMFGANFVAGTFAMGRGDYLLSLLNGAVCAFIIYVRFNRY